jgi:hypothetical protein
MSQMLVQPSGVLLKTVRTGWIQALVRHAICANKGAKGLPASATLFKTVQKSSVHRFSLSSPLHHLIFKRKTRT